MSGVVVEVEGSGIDVLLRQTEVAATVPAPFSRYLFFKYLFKLPFKVTFSSHASKLPFQITFLELPFTVTFYSYLSKLPF